MFPNSSVLKWKTSFLLDVLPVLNFHIKETSMLFKKRKEKELSKEAERLFIVLIHFIVWPVQVLGTIYHPRVIIWDHLLSKKRVICGRGSFAVYFGNHLRSGDHLRYRTVLESSSSWLGIVCLSIKLSWSRAEVTGEFVTYTVLSEGRFLLSGHLPEATAESSHFKWSPCGWFDCMLCLCWLIFAPLQPEVQFTVLNSAPTTGGSTSIC